MDAVLIDKEGCRHSAPEKPRLASFLNRKGLVVSLRHGPAAAIDPWAIRIRIQRRNLGGEIGKPINGLSCREIPGE
jgi:hypothetical protein